MQDQPHEGPELRQAQGGRWHAIWGRPDLAYDYRQDIGDRHVFDFYFDLFSRAPEVSPSPIGPHSDFDNTTYASAEDWSRYDGELM